MGKYNNTVFLLITNIIVAICIFVSCNNSSKDFYFEGEYPPVKTITYTEDGQEYNIEAVSGQILIYFKDGTSYSEAKKIIKQYSGKIIEQMPRFDYYLVKVAEGSENDFINQMRWQSSVEYVFLNTVSYAQSVHIIDIFGYNDCIKMNHGEEVRKTFERFRSPQSEHFISEISGPPISIGELFNPLNPFTDDIMCKRFNQIMDEVNSDELVLINRSLGFAGHLGREKEGCHTVQYLNADPSKQKSYREGYLKSLNLLASCFQKIEKNGKTNFILTNSSGNEGVHNLDVLVLNKLNPQKANVLKRHLVLVSAIDKKVATSYPNNTISANPLVTTIDISDPTIESGTSFASPKLLGWIDKITNEYKCLNAQYVLEIIRNATSQNSRQPLSYEKLESEAKKIAKNKGCNQKNENEYYYEPFVSVIEGMINVETFDLEHGESEIYTDEYGNESLTGNHRTVKDGEERYGVIYLDKPINIICNADCEEFYGLGNVSVYNISKIQLTGTWSPYQGKKVRLIGTFGYGITRHYYTNGVIMWVDKIEVLNDNREEKQKNETNELIGTKWKGTISTAEFIDNSTIKSSGNGGDFFYNYTYNSTTRKGKIYSTDPSSYLYSYPSSFTITGDQLLEESGGTTWTYKKLSNFITVE